MTGIIACRIDGSLPKLTDQDYEVHRRNPPAKILRGDPKLTKTLISGLNYAQKYTSGCLSFAESPSDIYQETMFMVMDSFEKMVKTGLDDDRITVLWVQHSDKGRLELNFVIPNVDLETGKRFAPYFDLSDRPRFQAWERLQNSEFGFADPSDPARKRAFQIPSDLPGDKLQQQRGMGGLLSEMVGAGLIKNRNELMEVIKNGGYTINRKGKDYISIADPKGHRLRLKGAIYSETFTSPENLSINSKGFESDSTDERQRKIAERREIYERETEKRRKYIEQRYRPKNKITGTVDNAPEKNPQYDHHDSVDLILDDCIWNDPDDFFERATFSDREDSECPHGGWESLYGDPVPRMDNLPTYPERAITAMQNKGVKDDDGDRNDVARRIEQAFDRMYAAGNELIQKIGRFGRAVDLLRRATQDLVWAGGSLGDRVRESIKTRTNGFINQTREESSLKNQPDSSAKRYSDGKPKPPSFIP
jgi:hypothetical protein